MARKGAERWLWQQDCFPGCWPGNFGKTLQAPEKGAAQGGRDQMDTRGDFGKGPFPLFLHLFPEFYRHNCEEQGRVGGALAVWES